MKTILASSAITLSLIGLGVTASLAQGGPDGQRGGARPSFEQLDTNGDGMISEQELQSRGQARFAEADSNGDGMLDMDELTAAAQRAAADKLAKLLERKDTNGDGMLSMEEMTPPNADRRFAQADSNGDGMISAEEWQAAQDARPGKRRGDGAGRPPAASN